MISRLESVVLAKSSIDRFCPFSRSLWELTIIVNWPFTSDKHYVSNSKRQILKT